MSADQDYVLGTQDVEIEPATTRRTHLYEVRQLRNFGDTETPPLLGELAQQPGVLRISWQGLP